MRARCFLACAALGVGCATAAPQADVVLLPQARVTSSQVKLGDVAHLSSADLDLMRRLVNLPLGAAPQPGQAAVVQRARVADWVLRTLGTTTAVLRWSGSGESRIARVSRQLRGDEVAHAAMEAARAWLSTQGMAGAIQVRHPVRDVDVPEGDLRLQPRPIEFPPLRNRLLVWVDVWLGEQFLRAIAVPLEVDAAPLQGRVPTSPEPPMEEGTALAVQRGEWAALRTGAGAVLLENRVEVLQDGRVGQRVRVRPTSGSGLLLARVVGRGQLELAP